MLPALVLGLLLAAVSNQDERATCATWADCREQALEAAAAEEYERFHDLAWLAVQKGRRNDPDLMFLLARAQSLSGRPLDALVMLRRLAELGVSTDAATSDDFRRVRALPAWEEVERTAAALPPVRASEPAPAKSDAPPAEAPVTTPPPAIAEAPPPPVVVTDRGSEILRFHAPGFTPAGLAYDAVSRRFIVGDASGRRLAVVDEFSHQVATLAGAKGAGFGAVAALAIDAQDGTLWVISNADGQGRLHKLQLISARLLATFDAPAAGADARFADVAVAAQGTVLVLDAAGRRILRLRTTGAALQVAASLGDHRPVSLAPGSGSIVYVAHEGGLLRVDLASGQVTAVRADMPLAGLVRVRWRERSLVGIQRSGSGHRAVRLRLSRDGRSVSALEILDDEIQAADPTAAAVVADTLYYLAPAGEIGLVVRRVTLKP